MTDVILGEELVVLEVEGLAGAEGFVEKGAFYRQFALG